MTADPSPETGGPVAAIEATGLRRSFGDAVAVDGVDLSVPEGVLYGLIGPDGAGKSTLLRMLATVLRPDSGEASVFGASVVHDPDRVTSQIGYMSQQFCLYPDLTVAENIEFFARLRGVPRAERRTRAASLLAALGLADVTTRRAGRLSGGMKQKLMLATTLMHEPRLLLLDEPTTGVDPVSRRDFWAILYRLRESGVSIVMATAYMDEAERCSRLALFHSGEVRHCDTPARLKAAMPGALLAVHAAQPRAVHRALAGLPGVLGALLMGDRVHVRVDDAARRVPELETALRSAGIADARIDPAAPGIEDVFVALLGTPAG